jgi:hypothetical protein
MFGFLNGRNTLRCNPSGTLCKILQTLQRNGTPACGARDGRVPREVSKNEKEFCYEVDRKIEESVSGGAQVAKVDWLAVCAFGCRRSSLHATRVSSKNPRQGDRVVLMDFHWLVRRVILSGAR